jgi:hypothetical protein
MAATFDRLSHGRLPINVVTGGDQGEMLADGIDADHATRHEISDELLRIRPDCRHRNAAALKRPSVARNAGLAARAFAARNKPTR